MTKYWDPPSARIAELIRASVAIMLDSPSRVYDPIDAAVLESAAPQLALAEPGLVESLRAVVRANVGYWATANYKAPGLPVSANLGPENVDLAREYAWRGLDSGILTNFHAGQNAAIQMSTEIVFELTKDPDELRELTTAINRSIFAYIDDTLIALHRLLETERVQMPDFNHVARLNAVELVLKGSPISARRASQLMRHELDRRHLAAVVWTDSQGCDPGSLERAVTALAQVAGAVRPLIIRASPSTMWVWISGTDEFRIREIRDAVHVDAGIRLAIGSVGAGLPGFRRSHLDAMATHRLMRQLPVGASITSYDEIEVVALATADLDGAIGFVDRILGRLATADPELRETLRVYLREGFSSIHTAKVLYAHRNTVANRLERARALLPEPLEKMTLQVALALEIVQVAPRHIIDSLNSQSAADRRI